MTETARQGASAAPAGYAGRSRVSREASIAALERCARVSAPPNGKIAAKFIRSLSEDNLARLHSFLPHAPGEPANAPDAAHNEFTLRAFLRDPEKHDDLLNLIRYRQVIPSGSDLENAAAIIGTLITRTPGIEDSLIGAHLYAAHRYDVIDFGDIWRYELNAPLMELVDRHPEMVEQLMDLRSQRQLRVITEDLLHQHVDTHPGLAEGVL